MLTFFKIRAPERQFTRTVEGFATRLVGFGREPNMKRNRIAPQGAGKHASTATRTLRALPGLSCPLGGFANVALQRDGEFRLATPLYPSENRESALTTFGLGEQPSRAWAIVAGCDRGDGPKLQEDPCKRDWGTSQELIEKTAAKKR